MGNAGGRLGMQLGLAVVGAVAGYYAPGVGAGLGFASGALIGGVAGSLLFPVESPDTNAQGPRLDDLTVQTSTYGNAIPVGYGTARIAGNVIWSTGIIETATTESHDVGGGKGGGSSTMTQTTYSYSASFAVALARGPIAGIRRIWADDKLWFDYSNPPVGTAFGGNLYLGTETQMPDPNIEADKGAGNVPAHRGLAYIVFTNLALKEFGNRIPNFHFEVVFAGTSTAHIAEISDGANLGYMGAGIAVDEETGLVWVTNAARNVVEIIEPNTWTVVKTITGITCPVGICYQPPYSVIWTDQLPALVTGSLSPTPIGNTQIVEMPPRMWIGTGIPLLIGGTINTINTRTYELSQMGWPTMAGLPTGISFYGIYYKVTVDLSTIDFDAPNQYGGQTVVFWEGGGFGVPNPLAVPIGFGGGIGPPTPLVYNGPRALGDNLFVVTDWCMGNANESIYVITLMGWIYRFRDSGEVFFRAQPVVSRFWYKNEITYDPFEDCVYALVQEFPSGYEILVKLDATLQIEYWRVSTGPFGAVFQDIAVHPQTGDLYANMRYVGANAHTWIRKIDKSDGSTISEFECDNGSSSPGYYDWMIYPNSMFAVGYRNANASSRQKIPLVNAPSGSITLDQVVSDLSTQVGLTSGDIDVTQLATDTVRGYVVANRMSARQAIEPLMRGYFFDACESDYKAKFVKRGGASIATIPSTDLGAHHDGEDPVDPRNWNRTEENVLPWQVDVRYIDPASYYKTNDQYTRRLVGQSKEQTQVDLPVVFTADEAKKISEVLLYNTWMDRTAINIKLSRQYLKLDPTDVITVTEAGVATVYRLSKVAYSYPNVIEAEAVEEDQSVYSMTGVGGAASGLPTQTMQGVVPTILYLMDLPALRDVDSNVGIYVAVTSAFPGWDSAEIYRSTDAVNYSAAVAMPIEANAGSSQSLLTWDGSIP